MQVLYRYDIANEQIIDIKKTIDKISISILSHSSSRSFVGDGSYVGIPS